MIPEFGLQPSDHSVPRDGLDIESAALVMQHHIECPITICPIKLYAKTLLVRAGRMRPAERPKFGY
ncbi:hypothetical protein AB0C65_05970 [Nocardia sp. NPDC048505]|uniref:hypothetical protein n=1 Tax=Nocardia sp. NPDC048505 TaxID=3155756 RepID=UPI0033C1AE7E